MLMIVKDDSTEQPARILAERIVRLTPCDGAAWESAVDDLVALAIAADPQVASASSRVFFRDVVEALADRFEPDLCDLYVHLFCRTITASRRTLDLLSVDRLLQSFRLTTEEELLRRAHRVRRSSAFEAGRHVVASKVLVPSRVTLGADIAVTSVVLQKMKDVFPKAELVLLGGAKAGAFFASDPRVRLREIAYSRGSSLRDRLNAWPTLVDIVRQEIEGLRSEEYVVVDPDSRLTQLGILPLVPDDSRYFFFESRSFASPRATSLGELTDKWLAKTFGGDSEACLPYVRLSAEDRQRGEHLREAAGNRRLAAVNLGVGDNPSKRVKDPFERELLLLLRSRGYAVVLDQGAGNEELLRTSYLIDSVRETGASVSRLGDTAEPFADLNFWRGSLSGFAGYIAASDLYVGYDSAGGHLAAALGVPGIDIFAGAASQSMIEHWTPWGKAPAAVIAVRPGQTPEEVLAAVQEQLP